MRTHDIITLSEIDFFEKISKFDLIDNRDGEFNQANFNEGLNKFLEESKPHLHTVLGFDIYRYSLFEPEKQRLIPFIFFFLYNFILENIVVTSPIFCSNKLNELQEKFISTGDGGYQILPTPIHAIIILSEFHYMIRLFNSGKMLPGLRSFIGSIDIRYAITMGEVYRINHESNHNHYGGGIITCSRIMSKDRLNRLLIDHNTYNWFLKNLSGVEYIQFLKWQDLVDLPDFQIFNLKSIDPKMKNSSILYDNEESLQDKREIVSSDIMHVGEIKTKDRDLSIYNLHLKIFRSSKDGSYSLSIGNMNAAGLQKDVD